MKKNKNISKSSVIALLSPIILLILLACVGFAAIFIFGEVQRYHIRNEIFSYVQENTHRIELNSPNSYQEFFYTATGLQDGGVEYGYYYSPDDDHCLQGEPYRKGYRTYGIPDDSTDWYYSEQICKNWFYYEIHDG